MVSLTLSSVSLAGKCQSTAVVLVGPLAVARRVLWNRVSILPSCCLMVFFLGIESLDFSEFWHETRKPFFYLLGNLKRNLKEIGEMGQNRPKIVSFLIYRKIWSLILFYNENWYYLLCSSTNSLFGKKSCSWDKSSLKSFC